MGSFVVQIQSPQEIHHSLLANSPKSSSSGLSPKIIVSQHDFSNVANTAQKSKFFKEDSKMEDYNDISEDSKSVDQESIKQQSYQPRLGFSSV